METIDDPNAHVAEFLRYFAAFPHPPRYAVLLDGPWGSGKTRLVRDIVLGDPPAGRRHVYVSLFGLSSSDEIDAAVLAAVYPIAKGRGGDIALGVTRALMRQMSVEPGDFGKVSFLNPLRADLYVFDDLERCAMRPAEVLGYINRFVEHERCRVVLVGNEAVLRADASYRGEKEKVVGRTMTVRAPVTMAYRHFLRTIDDPASNSLLATEESVVLTVFEQSGLGNLRLLQQAMWDFERVFLTLGERHRSDAGAVRHLLRLLVAVGVEHRAGRLAADDLRDRSKAVLRGVLSDAKGGSPFSTANARYTALDLADRILPDDVLTAVVVDGFVDAEAIAAGLDASGWFDTAVEPAWRTVWHAFERDDDMVELALVVMLRQFDDRGFTLAGEVLHVFGLMLRLADAGLVPFDRAEAFERCATYLDDVRDAGTLEPAVAAFEDDARFSSWRGLGFNSAGDEDFGRLYGMVSKARHAVRRSGFAAHAAALLQLLREDPGAFADRLAAGHSSQEGSLPIFAGSDPAAFADALLGLDAQLAFNVLRGFGARYQHGRLSGELVEERTWLECVRTRLRQGAETGSAIRRDRLLRLIHWNLDPLLGGEDATDQ